jgi:single-stranded-DNA-specific exonuclease
MARTFPVPPLRWSVADAADRGAVAALAATLKVPAPLAALLIQRGAGEESVARAFLRPELAMLQDPYSLAGMKEAVATIVEVVRAKGKILVHGDYDVDGQCATAMLTRVLRAAGAEAYGFVPHRIRDGYDFGPAGVAKARELGAALVITCDCGITAIEAHKALKALGIRCVITDHHIPPESLPDVDAIVDPQRPDDTASLKTLCGTGVAFKLAQALVEPLGLPANLPFHFLDHVALATVADLVPLVGENRILVRHGLKLLAQSRWPGLRALVEVSDIDPGSLRASHLGYLIGPRLNAVGRLGDAGDGVRLLLSDDPTEASALARELDRLNDERQTLDQRTLEEAIAQLDRDGDAERDAGLVLAGDGWHPGVVGIVASRVVERYGRPAFLIAFDGDIGKGSGRSISGYDLHSALAACSDLLEKWGGHKMAAGVTIKRDRLPEFKERFAAVARERLTTDQLGPRQRIDLELPLSDASLELEQLCRHLEPTGLGNPGPVFGARGVTWGSPKIVGSGHLKGSLTSNGAKLDAIAFGWGDRAPDLSKPVDVAFRLEENRFNGRTTLQARVVAISATGTAP